MSTNNLPDLYELWDYNDPEATAVTFRTILPQAKQAGDVGYTVELLTQIARTEGLQGNFAAAHTLLDEAEALITVDMIIPQMRFLLERGRAYNSAGEQETAVVLFKQAYDLGLQVGQSADYHTVDAAHMLGIAMPTNDERLSWNLLALELSGKTAVPRAQNWRGSLLNNIGWSYHDRGDYEQALAIFKEAYAWHEVYAQDKPERIRIARWCIGRTYRSLERYNEALTIQENLAAEYAQLDESPDGFVYEEIGECLLAMGREREARPYFAQAKVRSTTQRLSRT